MSTGLAKVQEIYDAINILKNNGTKDIAILKCTSSYPADTKDLNLNTIVEMRKKFKCEIGFSDHSLGNSAALSAIALGATIIEKHLTIKKNFGVDGKFSADLKEIKDLKKKSIETWQSKGKIFFGATRGEKRYLKYRRSIYVYKDIKKGEIFSNNNLKVIRPALGLHPRYLDSIVGRRSKKDLKAGKPLKFRSLK